MRIIFALFLALAFSSSPEACVLGWDPVTTYIGGAPATGINYKLYFTPAGSTTPSVVADTASTSATITCAKGTYTVTAYDPNAVESGLSNLLSIRICTFSWAPVTLDVNGLPAVGTVLYKIIYFPNDTTAPTIVLDPATIGTVGACAPGSYYTVAYSAANSAGNSSNKVVVRQNNSPIIRNPSN